jgi:serine/threonine protein kinase/Flp pilus assembly protein TadD
VGRAAFANASAIPPAAEETTDMDQPQLSPEIEAELARLKPEEAGERIGPYKLLQSIGEGGFGTVWMAEQEQPVRRRVALKIIKLGMNTKEVIARFEQERQALAMMEHPNIAKVLDAGATRWGRPFFAMELVRGIKITDYCDQANLTTEARLGLFIQTCNAIQHAHQKGIIHRDIKPSNILVTMHDGVPVPKVIDFGVAKATQQQRLTDLTLFTQFEQMVGTPLYMSPEQAEMSGLDIDTRSDIYSLGVLLYELLTGRTPFDPEELMRKGHDEIRRAIREQEPKRPSTFVSTMAVNVRTTVAQHRQSDPARLTGLLRGDLDWIVMKAIEKDRTRRYETANGFAKDIERHLANEPVLARPPSTLYGFRRFVKRHKVGVAASSFIAIALIIGLGTSTWLFFKERDARQRAVASEKSQERLSTQAQAEKERAEKEATKSQQVAKFLQDMLKGVGPEVALGHDVKLLRKILDDTAERVSTDLKGQPAVEAELRETLGGVYVDLDERRPAKEMFLKALNIIRSVGGMGREEAEGRLLNGLGDALMELGPLPDAEKAYTEALAVNTAVHGKVHPSVARSLHGLGYVLRQRGDLVGAETRLNEALELWKLLPPEEDLKGEQALAVNDLGLVWDDRGDQARAQSFYTQSLAMRRAKFNEKHPAVLESLGNIGMLSQTQGHLDEAQEKLSEVLAIKEEVLSPDHQDLAGTRNNLALVFLARGQFDKAVEMQRRVIKALPETSPHLPQVRNNLAKILRQKGSQSNDLAALLEALQLTPADPLTADAVVNYFAASSLTPVCSEKAGSRGPWQYISTQPDSKKWVETVSTDTIWKSAPAPHGAPTFFPRKANTPITSHINLWLRREFNVSILPTGKLLLRVNRFQDAEVFINGVKASPSANWSDTDVLVPCYEAALSALKVGNNILAAHCVDADCNAPIDVCIYATQDPTLGRKQLIEKLGDMIEKEPGRAELYAGRASAYARLGEWAKAAADLTKAIEIQRSTPAYWYQFAPILLKLVDQPGYPSRRKDALAEFAKEVRPDIAAQISRLALLRPIEGSELESAQKLAEVGAAAKDPAGLASRQFTQGLAKYRAGDFKGAIEWMDKSLKTNEQKNLPGWNHERERNRKAAANLVTVMAQRGDDDTKNAKQTLTDVIKFMDTEFPKEGSGDLGREWPDWLIANILRREAETLIKGESKTAGEIK